MAKANPEGIKWPTDKDRYDRNYLRLYGEKCPICNRAHVAWIARCPKCNGIGYVEKKK